MIPLTKTFTINDLTAPLQNLTMCNYMIYANGKKLNPKESALSILKSSDKILLYSVGGAASKPDGMRRFVRFPKHHFETEWYVGSNDLSICYVPQEDLFITGWGFYRHHYDSIDKMSIRTTFRIFDSTDTVQIAEVTHPSYYLDYVNLECDANKIQWYEFAP